jgi:hypothetical protein
MQRATGTSLLTRISLASQVFSGKYHKFAGLFAAADSEVHLWRARELASLPRCVNDSVRVGARKPKCILDDGEAEGTSPCCRSSTGTESLATDYGPTTALSPKSKSPIQYLHLG